MATLRNKKISGETPGKKGIRKMHKKEQGAFTLIELLIVVAIIAILAAIAVPNFLEAQVRSKIARCHADMRSMATAVEEYAVDWNMPAPGLTWCWTDPHELIEGNPQGDRSLTLQKSQSFLTTPVAYISSLMRDPFAVHEENVEGLYTYEIVCPHMGAYNKWNELGYTWAVGSYGPAKEAPAKFVLRGIQGKVNRGLAYDASNGTVSWGQIIRTNKGVWDGSPGG